MLFDCIFLPRIKYILTCKSTLLEANSFLSYVTASTKRGGGYIDKSNSNGGDDLHKLKNTDLVLPSPRVIQLGYATFILVLFSTLSVHVSYVCERDRQL